MLGLFRSDGSASSPAGLHASGRESLVNVALIECDATVEQAEADQAAVIDETNLASLVRGNNLTCSRRTPGPGGRERCMSNRYGRMERLWQACHDTRQPAAEVLAPVEPAVAREAVGDQERFDCGRSNVGRGRMNLYLPSPTSRIGWGAAGATCPV